MIKMSPFVTLADRNHNAVIDIETARLVSAAIAYARAGSMKPPDDDIEKLRAEDLLLQACRFFYALERLENSDHEDQVL